MPSESAASEGSSKTPAKLPASAALDPFAPPFHWHQASECHWWLCDGSTCPQEADDGE